MLILREDLGRRLTTHLLRRILAAAELGLLWLLLRVLLRVLAIHELLLNRSRRRVHFLHLSQLLLTLR